MVKKRPIEPSRRELLGGLAILIVLGGVAVSRSGSPQSTWANHAPVTIEPAQLSLHEVKAAHPVSAAEPDPVQPLTGDLIARDHAANDN